MKNSKDTEKEYLMLREEILHLDNIVNNTINFFYVFMASYSAFALKQEDSIFILLSYIVIIPAYFIVLNKMKAMCKIGAYLKIFHEGDIFNWETRHMKYKEINESSHFRIISWHFPFILVSLAVNVLLLINTKWSNILSIEMLKVIVCFMGLGVVLYNVVKFKNISPKEYIDKWVEVKYL